MHRIALFLVPLAAGCIIYDHTPCKSGKGECAEADTAGLVGEDEPDEPEFTFTLTPGEAQAGEDLIAALTVDGEFDLAAVVEVEAFGDVDLVATTNRGDEILLSLHVHEDAADGAADLLLHVGEGDAAFVEGALLIHAVEAEEDGTGGGSGDGSGDASGDGSGSGDGDCE